jgi:hypothetical protein
MDCDFIHSAISIAAEAIADQEPSLTTTGSSFASAAIYSRISVSAEPEMRIRADMGEVSETRAYEPAGGDPCHYSKRISV